MKHSVRKFVSNLEKKKKKKKSEEKIWVCKIKKYFIQVITGDSTVWKCNYFCCYVLEG